MLSVLRHPWKQGGRRVTQRELIDFLGLVKTMKTNVRHNWTEGERRESVADHSWRLALMPMLIEKEFPQVDINKVIRMCLIHDLGEAVTGDIPCFQKTSSDELTEKTAITSLLMNLPDDIRADFSALYAEMEELNTPEARLYKALDKMEAVISHNEAEISTWEDHEYTLQLTYGEDNVAWNDWLKELKAEVNRDTVKKTENESSVG